MSSKLVTGVTLGLVGALSASASMAQQKNPERNAYFGETHIHTSWSVDAWIFGNRISGPADAYKYAKGETIKHPLGYDIRIETPLDFMGVTDHSEYVGVTKQANIPGSAVSKLPEAQGLILKNRNDPKEVQQVFVNLVHLLQGPPVKPLMSPEVAGTVWKENVELADQANQPGKFTAFCSYEWTSGYDFRNLHRNIFFRECAKVPGMPFSALNSWHPEDLWEWMDKQRAAGIELLAISHNANLSDGWMYPTDLDSKGRPIDAAWAASRERNERLVEMKQLKGQSETHPLLSPNDEFADYEINNYLLGMPQTVGRVPKIPGSYARQALKDGIAQQDVKGFNPYKLGMAGGSDSHNSAAPYRQTNFFGGHAINDGTVATRMGGHNFSGVDVRLMSPAGLTGVWAEENTRASLWDAMYRKETFGTSGTRIKVRLFGGWDYDANLFKQANWIRAAYNGGAPMGSDLPPPKSKAPTFAVWAIKDPAAANLDRVQIVKGWTKSGQSFEKVFDVVWAGNRTRDRWTGAVAPIQNTVDVDKATYSNSVGSVELRAVWSDPEFDPSLHAFYYARVLEIPTPRWTTIQARDAGVAPSDVVPATVQERAWSSPIWYTPSADARKAAPPGFTVADLKQKGAVALAGADLKEFVVGKAYWMRNTVTGQLSELQFDADGQLMLLHVGRSATMPSLFGKVAQNGWEVTPQGYTVHDDKVVTSIGNQPVELSIYKSGDQVYAARSNEFGFANYELTVNPPVFLGAPPKGEVTVPADQPAYLYPTARE